MYTPHDSTSPVVLTGKHLSGQDDCACATSTSVLSGRQKPVRQNDCACAQESAPAAIVLPATCFQQATGALRRELMSGFWLVHSPYAPTGPSVLNAAAWERWQQFATPQPLSLPVDEELVAQGLIVPQEIAGCPPPGHPDTLTVWLHLTNNCNLACPYCYVNKTPAMMSRETGLQAIQAVIAQAEEHRFRALKLKYAGGEPTLNFPLLRTLASYARQEAQSHNLCLDQVLLSNGTRLTHDDALWLLENDLRVMISLDGIGEAHDRLRTFRDGRGSFAIVRKTIEEILLPVGILPSLSLTITAYNAGSIAAAVRWALERDLPLSLNFYRTPSLQGRDLKAEEEAIISGMLSAYRVFEEFLPTRPFFNGLLDRVQATPHRRTCGVGSDYLVITHQGKVAQCHMLLGQPIAENLQGDLLHQIRQGPVKNLPVEQKAGCRDCEYRYLCSGGCPVETRTLSGREDLPHPNCRIYKALLPEALRLEGLRLLKVHGFLN